MDRRSFLRACFALAAAGVVDPERLLWTPKPIVVVPEIPMGVTVGAINRATFIFWRNAHLLTPLDNVFTHDWLKAAKAV